MSSGECGISVEYQTYSQALCQSMGAGGGEGLSALPLKFFVNVPFFSIRRAFEVPFLKEVTKNVDEN